MSGGVSATPPSSLCSRILSQTLLSPIHCRNPSWSSAAVFRSASLDHPLYSSHLKLKPSELEVGLFPRFSLRCNSSARPGGPSPGESDNRSVLDAFFLGKALAEALSERIESTVGEFLSTIGRLQAEQQKQVLDFQEEVLEKAKRAKEKAAREAMEAQGLISKSSTTNISPATKGVTSTTEPLATDAPAFSPSLPNSSDLAADKDQDTTNTDPHSVVSYDD